MTYSEIKGKKISEKTIEYFRAKVNKYVVDGDKLYLSTKTKEYKKLVQVCYYREIPIYLFIERLGYKQINQLEHKQLLQGGRKCKVCGKILPATTEYFYVGNSQTKHLRTDCKECTKKYNKRKWEEKKRGYTRVIGAI